MINAMIEAISMALDGQFGQNYEIHMEEIRQGLKEPCFFIFCLSPSKKLFLGKRYFRTNPFCIQYFPATDEKQRECSQVAEQMYECLEYLTIDGGDRPIRGTNMKYEVVDGILNFFVNYDCFIYKVEQQTPMEDLETSTSIKEGGD